MGHRIPTAAAFEAYLGLMGPKRAVPGTDETALIDLAGDDAPDLKLELNALLQALTELPDAWRAEPLQRIGELAAERAKGLYPQFSNELCDEIARYCTWVWR
jgi:hypothetical protein